MTEPVSPTQPPPTPGRSAAPAVRGRGAPGAGDAVYGLGLIGALVYFWQDASSFWQYVLAVLKSLVWPALLVYDALRSVKG
jgi:hypothetical protein